MFKVRGFWNLPKEEVKPLNKDGNNQKKMSGKNKQNLEECHLDFMEVENLSCDAELENKIKEKIFKLQGRFVEDVQELQREMAKEMIKIEGEISFDLSKIHSHTGGIDVKLILHQ